MRGGTPGPAPSPALLANRRARAADRAASVAVTGAALLSIVIVGLVVLFLGIRATPVVTSSAIGIGAFFTSASWSPDANVGGGFGDVASAFGALTPIAGSLMVVGLALLIAVPLAISLALVIEETDPVLGSRYLRPAVEVFVGIPSVVYGYLGFTILLPLLRHLGSGGDDGSGVLAAGIVLAIMVVPTITTLSADGLRAVPRSLKEASLALGATEWQTIRRVLVPAARANIVTGIVLGLARAMGEALAVALVIGDANVLPSFRQHGLGALIKATTTMTVTITDGIQNIAINPDGTAARYMLALVLLAITFTCIVLVRLVNRRAPQVVP